MIKITVKNLAVVSLLFLIHPCLNSLFSTDITINDIELVNIPRGKFYDGPKLQGSQESGGLDEIRLIPAYEITISNSFYLGKFEVSRKQWQKIMRPEMEILDKDNDYPIFDIRFKEVKIYINRLNRKVGCEIENIIEYIDENGIQNISNGCFRLPTIAEWEYSRRGNRKHETNRKQFVKKGLDPIGNMANKTAIHFSNHKTDYPAKFKFSKFPENSFGLHNITGGVSEYCLDKFPTMFAYSTNNYNPITRTLLKDPLISNGNKGRAIMGKKWWTAVELQLSTQRQLHQGIYPQFLHTEARQTWLPKDKSFQRPVGLRLVYIK